MDRRRFFKITAGTAGSLVLEFKLGSNILANNAPSAFQFNAWLTISQDNVFTFILDRAEMGQGVMTALPTIMAEELDVNPESFIVEYAPTSRSYDNPDLGAQITGGSTSVHAAWLPLREAGFTVRNLIMKAAAKSWGTDLNQITTENGHVLFEQRNLRAPYGSLCQTALTLKPDRFDPKKLERRFVGLNRSRFENLDKVTGRAQFGIDIDVKKMNKAFVLRKPHLSCSLKNLNRQELLSLPGVLGIHEITTGIAIIGKSFDVAKRTAELARVEWNPPKRKPLSQGAVNKEFSSALSREGVLVKTKGNPIDAFENAKAKLEAVYECPYLAHATMEPQNCAAFVVDDHCEVWAPTQSPALAQKVAAKVLGISESKVVIHTTLLGGGFGRRLAQDYVAEAVELAKAHGSAVQIIWTREQDLRHSMYRPASLHQLKGAVDHSGRPVAWIHHIATQSILSQIVQEWLPAMMPDWIPDFLKSPSGAFAEKLFSGGYKADDTSTEGAKDIPYTIENVKVSVQPVNIEIPIGFWRSVGHSFNGFVVECFIDELATLAQRDPIEFRLGLLPQHHRLRRVLERAREVAQWGKPSSLGVAQGVATHESFRSFVALIVEVSVENKRIHVRRMVFVVDCGLVINPDMVRAQIESSAIFGMSAALKQLITFEEGLPQQSNFDDYPILRMEDCPEIECHIIESNEKPTGIGEPGVPVVAPAIANAVFKLSGQRLRKLPLQLAAVQPIDQ